MRPGTFAPNLPEDAFTLAVALGPGERRVLEAPIVAPGAAGWSLEATARAGTALVGTAVHALQSEALLTGQLVALLCAEESVCRDAQSRVASRAPTRIA